MKMVKLNNSFKIFLEKKNTRELTNRQIGNGQFSYLNWSKTTFGLLKSVCLKIRKKKKILKSYLCEW